MARKTVGLPKGQIARETLFGDLQNIFMATLEEKMT